MSKWQYLHDKASGVWVDAIQLIAEYCPQWTDDQMENLGLTIILIVVVLVVTGWSKKRWRPNGKS